MCTYVCTFYLAMKSRKILVLPNVSLLTLRAHVIDKVVHQSVSYISHTHVQSHKRTNAYVHQSISYTSHTHVQSHKRTHAYVQQSISYTSHTHVQSHKRTNAYVHQSISYTSHRHVQSHKRTNAYVHQAKADGLSDVTGTNYIM